MKVLSFDVGIKNLAFCLVDFFTDSERCIWDKINIKLWDIITIDDVKLCNICNKQATHTNKNNVTACKKHCKSQDLGRFIKIKKLSFENRATLLYEKLKIFDNLDFDTVLIENQPLSNPVMKSISVLLFGYFTFTKRTKTNLNIHFVNANIKLLGKLEKTKNLLNKLTYMSNYDANKKLCQIYCIHLINNSDYNLIYHHKKFDDLADSFMQAFAFTYGDNLPDKYRDIITNI
jgi:hypothetical protein